MAKIIKGYLTNFSENKNFTAESQGYVSAMEALAAKQAYENSIKTRLDWNRTQEGLATKQEKRLHAIPKSVLKNVPADYVYTGGNGYTPEGNSLAPIGIGLGALAGAAALGYGAYKLAKKKAELKANGYYAFDNEITKDKCRNLDNPGRTRTQLRNQYPNARIIKGNTAYQLNPQEFKLAANFSQENFAEGVSDSYSELLKDARNNRIKRQAEVDANYPTIKASRSPFNNYNQANAVEYFKNTGVNSVRGADSVATLKDKLARATSAYAQGNEILNETIPGQKNIFKEQSDRELAGAIDATHKEMNRTYGSTPMNGVRAFNIRRDRLRSGRLPEEDKVRLDKQKKAIDNEGIEPGTKPYVPKSNGAHRQHAPELGGPTQGFGYEQQ